MFAKKDGKLLSPEEMRKQQAKDAKKTLEDFQKLSPKEFVNKIVDHVLPTKGISSYIFKGVIKFMTGRLMKHAEKQAQSVEGIIRDTLSILERNKRAKELLGEDIQFGGITAMSEEITDGHTNIELSVYYAGEKGGGNVVLHAENTKITKMVLTSTSGKIVNVDLKDAPQPIIIDIKSN